MYLKVPWGMVSPTWILISDMAFDAYVLVEIDGVGVLIAVLV